MPRNNRPAKSGYARLSQADQDEEDEYTYGSDRDEQALSIGSPDRSFAPIVSGPRAHAALSVNTTPNGAGAGGSGSRGRQRPGRSRRRLRSTGSVDIKAINARLEHWAEEIASKFKIRPIRGKSRREERLEIHHSVFQAPDGVRPITREELAQAEPGRFTRDEFEEVVESVRVAIEQGVHPKMISQGSSGSYFARNTEGRTVGVFKPKDEEPYASRNPKWTKWIHRNLFPCFFGRACLIPNLSYVSEAAAYVLDAQLRTGIVPYTDVVYLSSKVFYYDFWQRSAFYRKRKPLPDKPGSFQVFLTGFKDANIFLKEHPWPDQHNSGFRPQDAPRTSRRPWTQNCRSAIVPGEEEDEEDELEVEESRPLTSDEEPRQKKFKWTPTLQQAFREQLEKLVILDYIMRNTDRGLDNWMVKVDWQTQDVSLVAEPPKRNGLKEDEEREDEPMAHPVPVTANSSRRLQVQDPYRRHEAMTPPSRDATPAEKGPSLTLGAIDNSLSWPWKHPDAWRSFPFGWLFLPVSLIGQPFSQKTRDHFLPLLTSTDWWSETQVALRRVFEMDEDFTERMFARQVATMKGQAWNVVETLKTAGHGPLELTRRTRVNVWDDLVDVPVVREMSSGRPSAESQRRHQTSPDLRRSHEMSRNKELLHEDEMDIGIGSVIPSPGRPGAGGPAAAAAAAASSSAPHPHRRAESENLLNFGSPAHELPNPNRFELSPRGGTPTGELAAFPFSTADDRSAVGRDAARAHRNTLDSQNSGGGDGLPPGRSSKEALMGEGESVAARRGSSAGRHGRRPSVLGRYGSYLYDPAEDEGDLGYGKAADAERNTRKVIVERLEAVKSRNPVFTWC